MEFHRGARRRHDRRDPADHARPTRPALAEFHVAQSAESRYRRFFSPKPTLRDAELVRFTNVDFVDRVAFVVEDHGEFVAWASYERLPNRTDAEVAFMVDDDHHGKGIATLLLEHLAAIARSNGIERFTAQTLGDNRACSPCSPRPVGRCTAGSSPV